MSQLTNGHYELEDTDGRPLIFDGAKLASVSSRRAEDERVWQEAERRFGDSDERERWLRAQNYRPRWMEMTIYRTRGGSYVLEIVGQTTNDGEVVRCRARVLDTAEQLIDALHNTDDAGTRYITYTARDALDEAMREDISLRDAWKSNARVVA